MVITVYLLYNDFRLALETRSAHGSGAAGQRPGPDPLHAIALAHHADPAGIAEATIPLDS